MKLNSLLKKSRKPIEIAAFLLTAFVLWFTLHQIPLMLDDLWYITNLETGEPLQGISDILQSQIWHFLNWGGRTMAHTLLQFLLLCNKNIIEIITVLTTFLLGYVISLFTEKKEKIVILEAIFLLLGLNADALYSMLWTTGAANYLYLSVFIFFYLYLYLRDNPDKKLPGITLWIMPLGLIVGWSNENMGPAVWVLGLIVMILRLRRKLPVYAWMILGNIFNLIGSILLIAAPGNFVRNSSIENTHGFFWNVFLRANAEAYAIFDYLPLAVMLTVIVVSVAVALKIKISERNLLLLLGAALSWGAMFLSPHYPARAAFGTMVFLVCVNLSLMHAICAKEEKAKLPCIAAEVFIGLTGLYRLMFAIADMWGWFK